MAGTRVRTIALGMCALLLVSTSPASAHRGGGGGHGPDALQLEHLDRGLVAAATGGGVFLSWRLLGHEVTGRTATGMAGPDFRVYRDGVPIATVTDSTNFLDAGAAATSEYRVAAVVGGREVDLSAPVAPWSGAFYDLPLRKPADGVTPVGEAYTYNANDMSVGDVDGDGQYEYIVKWDPSNSKDVSQIGYTGNVFIDAYELDGTLLYRIDLGVNIRAGAHYTEYLVYDFDGDGRSEMMFKTAPGTKILRYNAAGEVVSEKFITLPHEDRRAGVTHADDYRLSKTGYFEHLVAMFQGWTTHPEVVAGHWPATLEEAFGLPPTHAYPLSRADAEALVNYFIDVYAPSRSTRNVLRNFEGFIVDGPEYLTVFEGATGKELQTIRYKPDRHDDGLMWGDYALSRIEPGNRVDRFLAAVAYLDGKHPSAVLARGYYTRTTLIAYDWDGRRLHERWFVDSGWVPMTNPFNDTPHNRLGTDPVFKTITTQGFHSLSAADVDLDGKQEIVYGSATIDDDGRSVLYVSSGVLPPGSGAPGETWFLGHGDAMHVGDLNPDRPGLEIFTCHENATFAPYGMAMRDAATGQVLFGVYSGRDTGRAMVGDVLPGTRGLEAWASLPGGSASLGLYSAAGVLTPGAIPGTNQSIRWAADMTTQIVDGALEVTPTIRDWQRGVLLTADGMRTNNGTKGNPSLVADIFGDWREEMLLRHVDSSAIRIYLSTELTNRKLYTLMHDPQYRAETARQQTTYNQPAYPTFYFASDINWATVPVPDFWAPGTIGALRDRLDAFVASGDITGPVVVQLRAELAQADHHVQQGQTDQAVRDLERFNDRLRNHRVSDAARATLTYHAGTAISMLS